MTMRHMKKSEISHLVALCTAHADFEKSTFDKKRKESPLKSELFSTSPAFVCLVTEIVGNLEENISFMLQYLT